MWQRIQTLFLLISGALCLSMFFTTAYSVTDPSGIVNVSYLELRKPYFGILLSVLSLLTVLALIVYKSRILQLRLSVLSGLIALGMQIWLGWMYLNFEGAVFKWTVIFPFIIFICNMLAARGDFQDQLVVESAMRIRERRRHKK